MANFLDMECPKCGDPDRIDIAATIWVRVTEDGTDADLASDGSHDFYPKSAAQCDACGYAGQVADFHREEA